MWWPRGQAGERRDLHISFTFFLLVVFFPYFPAVENRSVDSKKVKIAICIRDFVFASDLGLSPKIRKRSCPKAILTEGPAKTQRIMSGNFWFQAPSLCHCHREGKAPMAGGMSLGSGSHLCIVLEPRKMLVVLVGVFSWSTERGLR